MLRLALIASILLLAGCATYETRYVYEDGYHAVRDGSRYAPARGAFGDYYVGQPSYRYVDAWYAYPAYLDWPAYYSVFWGFNRWYYDPFFYPGYYYGITYFPRHYHYGFSVGWSSHAYRPYRYVPYSPYRHAWHDHYYDWSWWHARYPSHRRPYERPRYGSARNEAERLAWQSRAAAWSQRESPLAGPGWREDGRRADYRSRPAERIDPRIGAFGSGEGSRRQDGRMSGDGARTARPGWREDAGAGVRDARGRAQVEGHVPREAPLRQRDAREDLARREWQPGSVQRAAPTVQTPPRLRPQERGEAGYSRAPQPERAASSPRYRGEVWNEPVPSRTTPFEPRPAPAARESAYRERPVAPSPRPVEAYSAPRSERGWPSEAPASRPLGRPEPAAGGYRPAPRLEQPAFRPEPPPRHDPAPRSESPPVGRSSAPPARGSDSPARSETRRGARGAQEWEP